MGAQLSGVAIQNRAAWAEVPWRAAIEVVRELASDCTPVEIPLLVAIFQQAEAGGMRSADVESRVGKPL
jgi:hypothetical protein